MRDIEPSAPVACGPDVNVDPMLREVASYLRLVGRRVQCLLAADPLDDDLQAIAYQLPDTQRWLGYAEHELARLREEAGVRCTGYASGTARYEPKGAAPRASGSSPLDQAVRPVRDVEGEHG